MASTPAMRRNVGAYALPQVGVAPQNYASDTTVNGTGIDRTGKKSCILHLSAGTVTAGAVDCKLQESSDDGATDAYADITGAAVTQITATGDELVNVDLSGAEKWIRAVVTTSGSTTNTDAAAVIVFGGDDVVPIA